MQQKILPLQAQKFTHKPKPFFNLNRFLKGGGFFIF